MEIVKLKSAEKNKLTKRSQIDAERVIEIVSDILRNVQEGGDNSLKFYTEKFDNVKLDNFKVSESEIKESYSKVDEKIVTALKRAAKNIKNFIKRKFQKNGLKKWIKELLQVK